MAVCLMVIFAALKLDVVASHHKLQHALALGAMLHRTFINRIMDAVKDMLWPLLPESKTCILWIDSFLSPAISISYPGQGILPVQGRIYLQQWCP
jgi:hypothetical protein